MSAGRQNALVTGGAGFIGSNLVDALVSAGTAVRVVDNLSTGRLRNLDAVMDRIEFIEGDLTVPDVAERACEGIEVVFHLAALAGVPFSMEHPVESDSNNVGATVRLLTAAKDAGCRRLVFSSSSSVYGGEGPFPQVETAEPRPTSPYAASKLACEVYLRTFATAFGTDCVGLRYFNVYGPKQPVKSCYSAVFPAFITRMLRGEPPIVHGDGRQGRDFTYVSDVVRANMLAADREAPFEGPALNVAANRETNLLDIIAAVNAHLGTDIAPVFEPERAGDVRHSRGDTTRAAEFLGFKAEVSIQEGIGRTIEHFRAAAGTETA
jgi:UDP-glucose 4-epimerase